MLIEADESACSETEVFVSSKLKRARIKVIDAVSGEPCSPLYTDVVRVRGGR
jgi:hypothetical protein